jgi:hypothetical protein
MIITNGHHPNDLATDPGAAAVYTEANKAAGGKKQISAIIAPT